MIIKKLIGQYNLSFSIKDKDRMNPVFNLALYIYKTNKARKSFYFEIEGTKYLRFFDTDFKVALDGFASSIQKICEEINKEYGSKITPSDLDF